MPADKYPRLEEVKNEIVDRGLIYGTIAGAIVYGIDAYGFDSTRLLLSQISDLIVVMGLAWITVRRRKLSVVFKSYIILIAIFSLVTTDLIEYGILSANKVLLILFPFFGVLVFSFKKMFWIYGIINVLILVIANFHLSEVLETKITNQYGLRAWVIHFALISVVSFISLVVIRRFKGVYDEILLDLTIKNKEIGDKEEHLVKYKDQLEDLVQSRTLELQRANSELALKAEVLNTTLTNLSTAQERLIHSEKMASLGMLASGVAHEINNPLNHIQGGIARLDMYLKEEGYSIKSEEIEPIFQQINDGIRRAASIVTSLNQYGPNSKGLNEKCDLHSIIKKSIAICRGNGETIFRIEEHLEAHDHLVLGSSGQLHQIMINLLTNAIHAIDEVGLIEIFTVSSKDSIVITVRDNGKGISRENLARIYEPFFTTKDVGEGTGLGLYIVFGIVQEHQGTIKVQSKVGNGTVFTIILPLL